MHRQIIFDAEARLELEDTVIWYNSQQPGLGARFESLVYAAFQRILANPERFRAVSQKTRQVRVEVFKKYSIYFRVEPDFIGIVFIFHGARNPAELRRWLK
jgi:plasmid stabilization system protein ParE